MNFNENCVVEPSEPAGEAENGKWSLVNGKWKGGNILRIFRKSYRIIGEPQATISSYLHWLWPVGPGTTFAAY